MKTVITKITGNNSLLGKFALEHGSTGVITDRKQGIKEVSYQLNDGETYYIDIIIYGDNDQGYKIEITGAADAKYPTSKIMLDGGYDNIVAKIVA